MSETICKHGLRESDIAQIIEAIAQELTANQHPKLYLFGSRARGTHRPYSDIDLVLTHCQDMSDRQWARIRHTLEESSLPYLIDLVSEEDLAEDYRASVSRDRVLVHSF